MTRTELASAVMAYAKDHYEEGWDPIVECYTEEDLLELIGSARTVKGAIDKVAAVLDLQASVRWDVRASSGEYDDVPHPAPVTKAARVSHDDCTHPRTAKARAACRQRMILAPKDSDFSVGYQEALRDIARALAEGGEAGVTSWLTNNLRREV